ncbi:hypothetical protein F5Y16DRAFT_393647 [Xylariaceae sp. FL0255]|nr:hypothetical protein F5Y16DRAFT_393647 [Xylariaceae sp. FL0255]
MPIRVRSKAMPAERALSPYSEHEDVELPDIAYDDVFRDVVKKISSYITEVIYMPATFEQLRTTSTGEDLRTLVEYLSTTVTNPAVVNALLALRWHYGSITDGRGLSEARANACEIVAWRFLTRLSEREAVEFCLYEIPSPYQQDNSAIDEDSTADIENNEHTALLGGTPGPSESPFRPFGVRRGSVKRTQLFKSVSNLTMSRHTSDANEPENDPTAPFVHLNALEIAAIADAKRFLSQHVVQKIITGIWNGQIMVTFCYDEVSEYIDAGSIFYAADIWNLFDMIMIVIGFIYFILRCVGLYMQDYDLVDIGFDVLALEALFMVPRVCSILSLSPYWGTLIPCLKAMGTDFLKFMVLVVIVYLGFLTTFSLVGRETFAFPHMAMIVTKIFFGSSYVGFDVMEDIDPIFAPFNLLALVIFRPLRLFLPSDTKFRQGRIILLRATHAPVVGLILFYEWLLGKLYMGDIDNFSGPRQNSIKRQVIPPPQRPDSMPRSGYRPSISSPRRKSIVESGGRSRRRHAPEDDSGDAPTDVEVRIAELTSKIDRLTALVVALQPAESTDSIRT